MDLYIEFTQDGSMTMYGMYDTPETAAYRLDGDTLITTVDGYGYTESIPATLRDGTLTLDLDSIAFVAVKAE